MDLPTGQYRRIAIDRAHSTADEELAISKLKEAISLREKWLYHRNTPEFLAPSSNNEVESNLSTLASTHSFEWHDGIVRVVQQKTHSDERVLLYKSRNMKEYADDLVHLMKIVNHPETRTYCYNRLALLEKMFSLHIQLNDNREKFEQKKVPKRDIYNVYKVDTHVHHSSSMNQKFLLSFMKRKIKFHADDPVMENKDDPENPVTLKQVFNKLGIIPEALSVDMLDVHADESLYKRFDRFNLKYNPVGKPILREIFLKTDNYLKGKYLAEMTLGVFAELEEGKYQKSEPRVSIYGRREDEWDKLSTWFADNNIYSKNVRWLIQVPRLYSAYKNAGQISSFQAILENLFNPLFEVTINPESNPKLHEMLKHVVGFDSVDDESKYDMEARVASQRLPQDWTSQTNPPYFYYQFYTQANLAVLNALREEKGMNTFKYRPHSGEAGDIIHLASVFLLADGINHGIELKNSATLQYLYYLTQIGIAMSPMSNNALFLRLYRNPFHTFFQRGLNVSLSTDDPLQFQMTRDPLMEEYSVAKAVWKLSNADVCELARNSVLQSGFEHNVKMKWIGENYYYPGPQGNAVDKTNVPFTRLCYRFDTLISEIRLLYGVELPADVKCLPCYTAGLVSFQTRKKEET